MRPRVVVVGASVAGVRAAEALRTHGFDGDVVLVDRQDQLPYDKPALSKDFLTADTVDVDLELISAERLSALEIDYRPSTPLVSVDLRARGVVASRGRGHRLHSPGHCYWVATASDSLA